jgi:hypothetical protein
MSVDLHLIEWEHPRLGRISEAACGLHEGLILSALRTLGIGCTGTPAGRGAACLRCRHDGALPREFLRRLDR